MTVKISADGSRRPRLIGAEIQNYGAGDHRGRDGRRLLFRSALTIAVFPRSTTAGGMADLHVTGGKAGLKTYERGRYSGQWQTS